MGQQAGFGRNLWLGDLAGRRFGLKMAEENLHGKRDECLGFQKLMVLEGFWGCFCHPLFFKHSRLFDIITAHFAIGP